MNGLGVCARATPLRLTYARNTATAIPTCRHAADRGNLLGDPTLVIESADARVESLASPVPMPTYCHRGPFRATEIRFFDRALARQSARFDGGVAAFAISRLDDGGADRFDLSAVEDLRVGSACAQERRPGDSQG